MRSSDTTLRLVQLYLVGGRSTNSYVEMVVSHNEKYEYFEEVLLWKNDEEWNLVKKDLRLLRSFSFVGEYNEVIEDIHPS